MTDMSTPKPELTFTVDGQLIGELGERLVTRNHVALAELIKNAYDADADSIRLEFHELTDIDGNLVPSIYLEDTGQGMSFADVRRYWMRIATDNKLRDPTSHTYGRPKTGNKGIGRFSCQRLAQQLVLDTVTSNRTEPRRTRVYFRWADFVAGADLTDVPCEYTRERAPDADSGTSLSLLGLRDEWTQRDFDTLRRSVVQLAYTQEVQRTGFTADPGFSINIHAGQFSHGAGDLLEQVLDAGWGTLRGHVDDQGYLRLFLKGKHLSGGRRFRSHERYPSFVGLRFVVGYLLGRDSYELNRDPTTLTRQVLGQIREHCGVRVYLDNFRVFPYGEPGDDWLRLDRDYAARKASIVDKRVETIADSLGLSSRDVGLLRPRNDNLLGRVFLYRDQDHSLQVKINREGFVDSPQYQQLITLLRLSIEWMTVHYAYARTEHDRSRAEVAERALKESVGESPAAGSSGEDSRDTAISVLSEFAFSHARNLNDQKAESAASRAKEYLERAEEHTRTELSALRSLASTAPLLFTFSHEVSTLIGRLDTHASRLRTLADQIRDDVFAAELQQLATDLTDTRNNFDNLYSLFGLVAEARRSKPKRIYVRSILDKLVRGARFSTDGSGIHVSIDCDRDLKSPRLPESEFVSVAVNLYSNAIKSTLAQGGDRIALCAYISDNALFLEVLDTGVGLPKKHRAEVPKPFVSDPAGTIYDRLEGKVGDTVVSSLGRGSGLGLSIVEGIVRSHDGHLSFFDADGWSVGVRVSLPMGKAS